MVVAMRTATARPLRWGSKSNVPRVGVRGHGLCVQLRAVKQAAKFGNLENWKIWTRFWNERMRKSDTCTHPPGLLVWDILHHLTCLTCLKKHPTVQKNCCYHWQAKLVFPSLHIGQDWINHKLVASHGFFWGKSTENIEQNYSTLRSFGCMERSNILYSTGGSRGHIFCSVSPGPLIFTACIDSLTTLNKNISRD